MDKVDADDIQAIRAIVEQPFSSVSWKNGEKPEWPSAHHIFSRMHGYFHRREPFFGHQQAASSNV